MGDEESNHVVLVAEDHESRQEEQEPCHSLPQVHKEDGCFVLLVHLFLVVYVVGTHLVHQGIIGTLPAQLVAPLGLVGSQGLGCKAIEVAVVAVVGGTASESIHDDNNIS